MPSLNVGQILEKRIQDKVKSLSKENTDKVLRMALAKMDDIKDKKTRAGKSPAKGGDWNNRYDPQYAIREKGGKRSPVTLRNNTRSIEKTKTVIRKSQGALKFVNPERAKIFKYHNDGTATGKKKRQIYPNTWNEAPEIRKLIIKELQKLWRNS